MIFALSSYARRLGAWASVLVLAALPLAVGGCSVNPATGEQSFTAFMSPDEEARVGREEHPRILAEFGGEYDNPEIKAYVNRIGQALAKFTETPNQKFTFTVLDSAVVNAFALPGGYVYVSRGLLALAENEAEFASVVGHEIGHVVARHSAQRYSQAMLGGLGATLLGVVTGSGQVADLSSRLFQIHLRSYSRGQEFEADTLGIRYMARAGYDVRDSAGFLAKLEAQNELAARMSGKDKDGDEYDIMSTHPRTRDRVESAAVAALAGAAPGGHVRRSAYLAAIDGMIYGDNPSQGLVRGRRFVHPGLRFAFEVPPGYRMVNTPAFVAARHENDARILFDGKRVPAGLTALRYLRDVWGKKVRLRDLESIEVNGLRAATAWLRVRRRGGDFDLRPVAIKFGPSQIYRFQFLTPAGATGDQSEVLRRTTYSFRRISAAEAKAVGPYRVRVHTVADGETEQALADRLPFEDFRVERFRVLNGLAPGESPVPGQKIKLIAE
ncbi:MAG: M48 family metalloprotease [Alphaproteobacteria bacterium]